MAATQHFYDRILHHMEREECPAGIFRDLSRAFDSLNYQLLLDKVEAYSVRGVPLKSLTDFLVDREKYGWN